MAENKNLFSSSNSTQGMDVYIFYSWCKDFPTALVVWSAISLLCFFLGFPATLWVLHELLQRQRQRSTSDIFMLSLAVTDLIFTAQIPLTVCNFMLWQIKELQISFSFIHSLSIGRPLFMACICWDCYVAVVHPIVYKTSKKLIVIKKALVITICLTLALGGLVMCFVTGLITTPLIAVPLLVALPVITFCDISILRALRKPDPTGKNNIHPQKKQALHTISNSFIMTFVIYLPPTIIFSFGRLMFQEEKETYCCLAPYGFCFGTAGCVFMPVLYLVREGKLDNFKDRWKKLTLMYSHNH